MNSGTIVVLPQKTIRDKNENYRFFRYKNKAVNIIITNAIIGARTELHIVPIDISTIKLLQSFVDFSISPFLAVSTISFPFDIVCKSDSLKDKISISDIQDSIQLVHFELEKKFW